MIEKVLAVKCRVQLIGICIQEIYILHHTNFCYYSICGIMQFTVNKFDVIIPAAIVGIHDQICPKNFIITYILTETE